MLSGVHTSKGRTTMNDIDPESEALLRTWMGKTQKECNSWAHGYCMNFIYRYRLVSGCTCNHCAGEIAAYQDWHTPPLRETLPTEELWRLF